jgi:hypothetical protein
MAVGLHWQKRVLAVTRASGGENANEPEDTTATLLVEIRPALLLSELRKCSRDRCAKQAKGGGA